jgi:hypothetical protein
MKDYNLKKYEKILKNSLKYLKIIEVNSFAHRNKSNLKPQSAKITKSFFFGDRFFYFIQIIAKNVPCKKSKPSKSKKVEDFEIQF